MNYVLKSALIAVFVSTNVYASDSNYNPNAVAHANANGIQNSNPNSALHGGTTTTPAPTVQTVVPVYSYLTITNFVTVTKTVTNIVQVASCDALKAAQKKFFNLNSLPNDYYIGGKPRNFISDGTYIYLSLSETSTQVVKLNPDTGAVLARFDVGSQPCGLAYTGGNYIMVALQRESSIVKVNTTTGKVEARVAVDVSPLALAFDGTFLYTGSYEKTSLTRIDPITMTIKGTYQVGFRPCDIACNGKVIWVASYGDNTVSKFDKNMNLLGKYSTGYTQPYGICFEMGTENVWVTHFQNGGVGVVTKLSSTGQILKVYNVGKGAAGICPDGNGGMLVTAQASAEVYRIDIATGATESVKTSPAPYGVIYDGVNCWVASQLGGCINKR